MKYYMLRTEFQKGQVQYQIVVWAPTLQLFANICRPLELRP